MIAFYFPIENQLCAGEVPEESPCLYDSFERKETEERAGHSTVHEHCQGKDETLSTQSQEDTQNARAAE
jgi:hypothetical protein